MGLFTTVEDLERESVSAGRGLLNIAFVNFQYSINYSKYLLQCFI